MKTTANGLLARLAPILGAGAVGACPLCWAGSASLLSYLGLGTIVPLWPGFATGLLVLGLIGFAFDYRSHRNPRPLLLLILGDALLFLGRFVWSGAGLGSWQIWVPGGIVAVAAVIYNRKQFVGRKEL